MPYQVALWVHVYAMGTALILFLCGELLLVIARGERRLPAKNALLAYRVGGILMAIGVVAGIALVFLGGWSLLTPWLLIALALIGGLLAIERKMVSPWAVQAQTALRTGAPVRAIATDGRALAGRVMLITLFVLIVALMVTKPEFNLLQR